MFLRICLILSVSAMTINIVKETAAHSPTSDMDNMSERLDMKKWKEVDASQKAEGYKEYVVSPNRLPISFNSYRYHITPFPEKDPMTVIIEFTAKNQDPLKNIGTAWLLLKDHKITGIHVHAECYQLQ